MPPEPPALPFPPELAPPDSSMVPPSSTPVLQLIPPTITKTHARTIPETFDREVVLARALELDGKIEPGRPIRLLGFRAEMSMPEEARKGHTPTRSGW